jgi:serine/threonine protein phosphatase PrpC
MPIQIEMAGLKDSGLVKDVDEGWIHYQWALAQEGLPLGLFVVADGSGGSAGAELPSEAVVQSIERALADLFASARNPLATTKFSAAEMARILQEDLVFEIDEMPPGTDEDFRLGTRLSEAVAGANTVLLNLSHASKKAERPASTVTAALVKGSKAHLANVGNSRAYLFRAGKLKQITRDHSLAASLVAAGQIEAEELYTHPQRHLLYRLLGEKPEVTVDTFDLELVAGDRLLLCSDGLWEMVRDPQITEILEEAPSARQACRLLVRAANKKGGQDNIAVIVVGVG